MEDFRYNSAVYTSLAANDFVAIAVASNHFEPGAYRNTSRISFSGVRWVLRNTKTGKEYGEIGYQADSHEIQLFNSMLEGRDTGARSYEDLTRSQCANLYSAEFVSSHRNLFLITNYTSNVRYNNTILVYWFVEHRTTVPSYLLCSFYEGTLPSRCDPNEMASRVASGFPWRVMFLDDETTGKTAEVTGCKSERVAERCKVQFSLGIMIAVICCNLVKACCMVMASVRSREPTLVTLGDAIDSFLRIPDPTTTGICFADRRFIEREWMRRSRAGPKRWKQIGVQRWWTSVSKTRWITCNFFCSIAIVTTGVLLGMGIGQDRVFMRTDIRSL